MSVKLETKNWQFEITWRELAVTPRTRREAEEKAEPRGWPRLQPALAGGAPHASQHTHNQKERKRK
jgi:hypothetical protein